MQTKIAPLVHKPAEQIEKWAAAKTGNNKLGEKSYIYFSSDEEKEVIE